MHAGMLQKPIQIGDCDLFSQDHQVKLHSMILLLWKTKQ